MEVNYEEATQTEISQAQLQAMMRRSWWGWAQFCWLLSTTSGCLKVRFWFNNFNSLLTISRNHFRIKFPGSTMGLKLTHFAGGKRLISRAIICSLNGPWNFNFFTVYQLLALLLLSGIDFGSFSFAAKWIFSRLSSNLKTFLPFSFGRFMEITGNKSLLNIVIWLKFFASLKLLSLKTE